MNFYFGNQILALKPLHDPRAACPETGGSAQAVSKWGSGTKMPDIQMLPDLSVIFGITIDDLFAMTDEHRMERIGNMLHNVRFLSSDEFLQHKKYLKELQSKPEHCTEAGLLLAMLYNKRANEYHELAKTLARAALQQIPGKKDAKMPSRRRAWPLSNLIITYFQLPAYKLIICSMASSEIYFRISESCARRGLFVKPRTSRSKTIEPF